MFGNKLYANIFCSSTDNLKCTPSDRRMYPWGYMYPRLGTSVLGHLFALPSKDECMPRCRENNGTTGGGTGGAAWAQAPPLFFL